MKYFLILFLLFFNSSLVFANDDDNYEYTEETHFIDISQNNIEILLDELIQHISANIGSNDNDILIDCAFQITNFLKISSICKNNIHILLYLAEYHQNDIIASKSIVSTSDCYILVGGLIKYLNTKTKNMKKKKNKTLIKGFVNELTFFGRNLEGYIVTDKIDEFNDMIKK